MCTARVLSSHILNYSFVHSISHLLYGSFQLYYGWIWNVLHRLLSLISSPALLSRQMEGPWMKWVTGNRPWYWTAQPCFLSSLCSQRRWKQAAVTWSHYHRAHCSSLPPSFRTQVQTNPPPPLGCFLSGIWAHRWEKQQKWTSSSEHVFQFTINIKPHFAFSTVDSLCFQENVQSSEKPLLSLSPFLSHYPHPKLICFLVCIILCSSRTTLHCFSNCRLRHETNAAHYNQNYICNGNKENSPENVREHHT